MKQRFPCIFVSAAICIMFFEMSFTASAQTQACAPPWQVGIPITVGEVLSFNGHNWQAIQGGYTTINGWEPPNTPALWSDLGPCSGGGGGGSCFASPSAPSGLSASATTTSGPALSLAARPAPAKFAVGNHACEFGDPQHHVFPDGSFDCLHPRHNFHGFGLGSVHYVQFQGRRQRFVRYVRAK